MFAQSNFFGLSIVSIAIYYKLHGRIMMPKVGKKHFAYTEKGKKKAKDYAKKVGAKLQEVGTVGALAAQRKRERDPSDFLSVGKRSTKRASNVGLETQAQRAASNLKLKQQQQTGKMGGGATNILVKRRLGIAAGTEMNWEDKLVEHLIVEKDWIQGAVNPAHKGFCSPMTKSTCTPARKALAKRFKKAARKEKRSGGTGWEGKV